MAFVHTRDAGGAYGSVVYAYQGIARRTKVLRWRG